MRTALIAWLGFLSLLPAGAAAAPGDIDRRFGSRGLATAERLEGGTVGALDRNQHLLIAGGSQVPGVARLTPDGRFDRRFGTRGIARHTSVGTFIPFAVRRGRDGQVKVDAAAYGLNTPPAAFIRWSARGHVPRVHHALDPFSGPLGRAGARPGGGAFLAHGTFYGPPEDAPDLRAVRRDGTTDTAFAGGSATLCPPKDRCRITAVAPADDGLLAAVANGENGRTTVLRLSAGGEIVERVSPGHSVFVLKPRPDGSVLALGTTQRLPRKGGVQTIVRVTRILPGGGLDPAFAAVAFRPGYTTMTTTDLEVDGRGRVYALVNRRQPGVIRFTASGRRDSTFGRRGVAWTPLPKGRYDNDEGLDLLLDRRRGVIVVGKRYRDGRGDPVFGCAIRDDFCASEVRLGVWRFRR